MKRKCGRLSKEEGDFIAANAAQMPPRAIADKLGRTPETVEAYIRKHGVAKEGAAASAAVTSEILLDLKESMAWKNLADEFDPQELRYFGEKYVAYKAQFKDNIEPSEEGQLFKLIKFEILMHRNLVQQKGTRESIERVTKARQELLLKAKLSDKEGERLRSLGIADASLKEDEKSLTAQHDKLDTSHQNIMKSLKATREQRISRVESNKRGIGDILRILQDQDGRDAADRMADMMKKQSDKELRRLGAEHQYMDGQWDRPILSADTVDMETRPERGGPGRLLPPPSGGESGAAGPETLAPATPAV